MHVLLFFIGILFCIWFLMPFFTKRILNPGNVTGLIFSVLLTIYGIFPRQIRQGMTAALAQPRIFSPALRPFSRPACSYLPSVSYQCLPHLIRHKGASPAGMHAHCFRLQGLRHKGKPYARRTHGCRHRLSACQSGQQMHCFRAARGMMKAFPRLPVCNNI